MLEVGEYLISSEADFNGFFNSCLSNKKIKRRFSDEQIKSLETMFESQSKLDPRKKLQFAKELGLQPRQVGIWFQNKRARWKSKQLERDYNILRANYDALASRFESMKIENQSLVFQVKKLKELMEKNGEERECCRREPAARISSTDGNSGVEMKACSLSEQGMGIDSDEGSSTKAEYFGIEEEEEKKKLVKVADGSLASTENWEGLESDALLDHSATDNTGYNQWWDFWG